MHPGGDKHSAQASIGTSRSLRFARDTRYRCPPRHSANDNSASGVPSSALSVISCRVSDLGEDVPSADAAAGSATSRCRLAGSAPPPSAPAPMPSRLSGAMACGLIERRWVAAGHRERRLSRRLVCIIPQPVSTPGLICQQPRTAMLPQLGRRTRSSRSNPFLPVALGCPGLATCRTGCPCLPGTTDC